MIDQRINDSLKELEQGLKNIDSARKQVERTINSYDGLHNSTSEYVAQLGNLTTKVKELVTAIGTDYNQKATAFDKDRKVIVDSANSAIQSNLRHTTHLQTIPISAGSVCNHGWNLEEVHHFA